jgi:hypothetical protein
VRGDADAVEGCDDLLEVGVHHDALSDRGCRRTGSRVGRGTT